MEGGFSLELCSLFLQSSLSLSEFYCNVYSFAIYWTPLRIITPNREMEPENEVMVQASKPDFTKNFMSPQTAC